MQYKKIKGILLSGLVAFMMFFTACGAGEYANPSSSGEEASVPVVTEESAEDSLDGLIQYFMSEEIIVDEAQEMEATIIGAEKGKKFRFGFNGNRNVSVELYEFDVEHINETAQAVFDEVKSTGHFTVLDTQVEATLSNSQKYLMVYVDSKKDEKNIAQKQKAIELLKTFKE